MRLRRQRLDVARQRIVAFVAMQVDRQAALGGDLAQRLHARRALRHRALEMRDAADDVDAEIERARQVAPPRSASGSSRPAGRRRAAGRDRAATCFLHVEQRLDREQPVVADVDMAADGEQAARHREIAIAQRALRHGLMGQQRLQLAPQRDAFEQRAGHVEARQAERQRRVEMEMAIDERRADEPAFGVERLARLAPLCPGAIATMRPSRAAMSRPCGRRAAWRCGRGGRGSFCAQITGRDAAEKGKFAVSRRKAAPDQPSGLKNESGAPAHRGFASATREFRRRSGSLRAARRWIRTAVYGL